MDGVVKGTGGGARSRAGEVKLRDMERDGGITITRRIVEPVRSGKQRPSKMKTPCLSFFPRTKRSSRLIDGTLLSSLVPVNLKIHSLPETREVKQSIIQRETIIVSTWSIFEIRERGEKMSDGNRADIMWPSLRPSCVNVNSLRLYPIVKKIALLFQDIQGGEADTHPIGLATK